jgi:glycosyltransferase 2 family protein
MTKPFPAPIPPPEEHQGLQPAQIQYVATHRQLLRESGQWARRKKEISLFVRVAVTLVLFAFLLKSVSWSALGAILAHADRVAMIVGLAVGTGSLVLSTAQWQSLLRAEHIIIGISKLIRLSLVGIAFNHFLPGGIGGEAVKALCVRRESGNGAGSVGAIVMSRFTGFFGRLLVALPVLIIWLSHFTSTLVRWFVLLSLLIGSVFCGAIFSTTLLSRVAKGSWIKSQLSSHRILDAAVRIANAIRISARRPRSLSMYRRTSTSSLSRSSPLLHFSQSQSMGLGCVKVPSSTSSQPPMFLHLPHCS